MQRNKRSVNPRKIDADDALNMAEYRGQDMAQMRVTPGVNDEPIREGKTLTKKTKE